MSQEFDKYQEFTEKMEQRFPKMFSGKYGGFAIGEGWWPIIEALCGNIQAHIDWKNKDSVVIPQVTVMQIKEKFGGLRFYYNGGDDTIHGMVSMAESWADASCEVCGERGTRRSSRWIKTLCDTHAKKD